MKVAELTEGYRLEAPSGEPVWLRRYARLVVGSILFLIFLGALVTSNYAGLSVPDWPTTYGQNMFLYPVEKWQGGIFYEHSHRLVASGIGMLTVILMAWVWLSDRRRSVRILATVALALVCIQGTLGGMTVLFGLPTIISASHGVLAQTFLGVTVVLAYMLSAEFRLVPLQTASVESSKFRRAAFVATAMVYLQLIVAAFMRHTYSGLAIPDFPAMGGSLVPRFGTSLLTDVNALRASLDLAPVYLYQVGLHLAHRLGALLVGVAILNVFLAYRKIRNDLPQLLRQKYDLGVAGLVSLYGMQFTLGVISVWSLRGPVVTSIHVVTGASLLALSVLVSARGFRIAR